MRVSLRARRRSLDSVRRSVRMLLEINKESKVVIAGEACGAGALCHSMNALRGI